MTDRIWALARTLGPTPTGGVQEAADQAHRDAVRGTPGGVIPQANPAWTAVVVVREMTHVLDPAGTNAASAGGEFVHLRQAVIEGDAHRVARVYLESLSAEVQDELPAFPALFPEGPDPASRRGSRT
ncbi:MAG: hypothetical protein ACI8Y4_003072 [Candidatus Poriferisodalaceae bacterium]